MFDAFITRLARARRILGVKEQESSIGEVSRQCACQRNRCHVQRQRLSNPRFRAVQRCCQLASLCGQSVSAHFWRRRTIKTIRVNMRTKSMCLPCREEHLFRCFDAGSPACSWDNLRVFQEHVCLARVEYVTTTPSTHAKVNHL